MWHFAPDSEFQSLKTGRHWAGRETKGALRPGCRESRSLKAPGRTGVRGPVMLTTQVALPTDPAPRTWEKPLRCAEETEERSVHLYMWRTSLETVPIPHTRVKTWGYFIHTWECYSLTNKNDRGPPAPSMINLKIWLNKKVGLHKKGII